MQWVRTSWGKSGEFQADDLNRGAGFEDGDAGAGVASLGDPDRLGDADDPDPRARG